MSTNTKALKLLLENPETDTKAWMTKSKSLFEQVQENN
jgi:hypothetical protein